MSPYTGTLIGTTTEEPLVDHYEKLIAPQAEPRKYDIVYESVVTVVYLHAAALYGLYLAWTTATWSTLIFHNILFALATLGVTAGAHRLWTHRAYKAKMPLQLILIVLNSLAYQYTAITWIRDHRLHHRYSDTDADPHNATRGFFFSHMGWILVRKHSEVKRRGKFIDMSDVYANPVLRFQKKYALPFIGTICFVLPTIVPIYLWGESLNTAWHLAILRYVCNLHNSSFVNSVAHLRGNKPYDKSIKPSQNLVISFFTLGEGFHNYHHVFPWDYKTAELGNNFLNVTTYFIDFFAWLGWAYDLKSVSEAHIQSRSSRCGDGSNSWGIKCY